MRGGSEMSSQLGAVVSTLGRVATVVAVICEALLKAFPSED